METIFLEIPTINRKQEALDYLAENIKYNSDLNGTGDMDMCLYGATYEEWLLELKLGEEKILLVCTVDNIGSNKTILALGGELEKTKFDEYDNTMTNYYWINVNDAIEKNYEHYKNYLKFVSKIKK